MRLLSSGQRAVAIFEAAKGAIVLLVGFGLLSLAHRDIQHLAERLVLHTHLNPASHYPHIFIDMAAQLNNVHLALIAAGAAAYSLLRFFEAYGLWFGRHWAECLAVVSGAVYVPIEIFEVYERMTLLSVVVLLTNSAILGFMLYCLFTARKNKSK